jgi:branched-chain amino acid aminotransferase
MLNTDGFVTEGSGDNIFIIKNGELFTPPSEAGILEGITRMFVKDRLCPMLGLKCTEKAMRLEDVLSADEVFLTGSAAEIIACTQIDQHDGTNITKVNYVGKGGGNGKAPPEGPITNKLRAKFREIVTSNAVPEE